MEQNPQIPFDPAGEGALQAPPPQVPHSGAPLLQQGAYSGSPYAAPPLENSPPPESALPPPAAPGYRQGGPQGGAYGGPYGFWPGPAAAMPPPPAQRRRSRHTPLQIALLAVATALLVLVALVLGTLAVVSGQLGRLFGAVRTNNSPPKNSFSVLQIVGTIQNVGGDALGVNDPSYHHADTVNHIKALAENENNTGILLYMNTPGGGVYESDEVYLALMAYKEATDRPVWVYMADTCASGGYYVAAAADHITANRNTITGSIGVYISLTDTSGLYDMLGIETVLVRSGENKGVGMSGVPITGDQRAVYQSIVDEDYAMFVDIVSKGRGLPPEETKRIADGRIYSGTQALANGLVDDLGDWDTLLAAFEEETGAAAFYTNFSTGTALGSLIGSLADLLPQNEIETQLSMAEKYPAGVPMALYEAGAA